MTKETTKRVVLLSDEEIERLLDWTEGDTSAPDCDPDDEGLCTLCEARDKLRAALDQPQGEERARYRVQYVDDSGIETTWGGLAFGSIEVAKRALSMALRDTDQARIQQRTVIQTPWQDIDQQEGGA